ncbi:MAG: AbrB/MazE/SpoVT family DNA-binding domain-containing protein [Nitrospinales bacterium]
MKIPIVRIGNSRGIRIPKSLLKQCHLEDEVELEPRGDALVIKSSAKPRAKWDEAFRKMAERCDDALPAGEDLIKNSWDEDEWVW